MRIAVETLNLDAASYRQLAEKHTRDGAVDGGAVRAEVLDIVATRGKMQNPVTGSGRHAHRHGRGGRPARARSASRSGTGSPRSSRSR